MNDTLIQEFHDECTNQDLFDEIRFKHRFRKELILEAYEKSEVYNENRHVNGLFWCLLFGKFDMAYYMIENGYFDPTKLFVERFIFYTYWQIKGGRSNSVKSPKNLYGDYL